MRRIGRFRFGMGAIIVAIAITTGILRSGRPYVGGGAWGGGSGTLLFLVVGVLGIAVLARRFIADRPTRSSSRTDGTDDTEAALERLKGRYVAGEIDETEYERKLATLFETETVPDAPRVAETRSPADEHPTRRESRTESEERYPPRHGHPSKRPRSGSRRCHGK